MIANPRIANPSAAADLHYWKKRAHEAEQRAREHEFQLKEAQPFLLWENELFASKALGPNEKLLIRQRYLKERSSPPEEKSGQKVWRCDLEEDAAALGVSPSTVSRLTERLATNKLLSRIEIPYTTRDGKDTALLYGRTTELVARPSEIAPEVLPSPKKHGGNHYACRHCQQPYKSIRRRVIVSAICENPDCDHCGSEEVLSDERAIINQTENAKETKEVEATCFYGDLPENSFFARRHETQPAPLSGETEQATAMHITSQIEETEQTKEVEATCFYGDLHENSFFARRHEMIVDLERYRNEQLAKQDAKQLASLSIDRDLQVATQDKTNSAPQRLQPGQLLKEASCYLVKVAGDEPLHGEMNMRDQAGNYLKYGYVHRSFTEQDAQDHLLGRKTKAARIRYASGKTYALVIDADTGEDTEQVRVGAHLLTSAGYKVLLDEADIARGPHLWILYNEPVDAVAARRHICEIAPMLGTIKEYWPCGKQNVRLLGGKYVTPTESERCKLYDGYGVIVATTGKEIAAALLAYQNDATIVPIYPPDPEPKKKAIVKPVTSQAQATGKETSFDCKEVAAWFNDRNTLESILPSARIISGRPCAFPVWREHGPVPHVVYHGESNTWVDYGDSRRGGDAFQLARLVAGDEDAFVKEQYQLYRAFLLEQTAKPVTSPAKPVETDETSEGRGALSALKTPEQEEQERYKKRIEAYGVARGYPRSRLSDNSVIPGGARGWNGFLKNQEDKHEQAYNDILAGTIKTEELE